MLCLIRVFFEGGLGVFAIDIWCEDVRRRRRLTPWCRGLTPKLISDMLCLCEKRNLCLSVWSISFHHTLSEPCEVCWSAPSNYSLKFCDLSLAVLAYLLLFHCFDSIMGCNYMLITCVWNLLSCIIMRMAQVDYLADPVIIYLKQPGNYRCVTLINTG